MSCWLRENGFIELEYIRFVSVTDSTNHCECDGPAERVHLISKQLIKSRFPRGAIHVTNGWVTIEKDTEISPLIEIHDLAHMLTDERIIVQGCRKHHALLDHGRTLRVKRESLSESVEEFAYDYGLGWFLEKEYGCRCGND